MLKDKLWGVQQDDDPQSFLSPVKAENDADYRQDIVPAISCGVAEIAFGCNTMAAIGCDRPVSAIQHCRRT